MTAAGPLFGAEIRYVIDASSLIDLRRIYPPDVVPGAWALVEKLASDGVLASIDEVLIEVKRKDDEVAKWAKLHSDMFLPMSTDVQRAGREVLRTHRELLSLKDRTSGADPFLIGAARLHAATVVTEETRTGKPHRPHIPNVCEELGVPCIKLVQMFRAEGLRLVAASETP